MNSLNADDLQCFLSAFIRVIGAPTGFALERLRDATEKAKKKAVGPGLFDARAK